MGRQLTSRRASYHFTLPGLPNMKEVFHLFILLGC